MWEGEIKNMAEPSDDIKNWAQKIAEMQDSGLSQHELYKVQSQFYKEAFDKSMVLLKESQEMIQDLMTQSKKIKEMHEKLILEVQKNSSH